MTLKGFEILASVLLLIAAILPEKTFGDWMTFKVGLDSAAEKVRAKNFDAIVQDCLKAEGILNRVNAIQKLSDLPKKAAALSGGPPLQYALPIVPLLIVLLQDPSAEIRQAALEVTRDYSIQKIEWSKRFLEIMQSPPNDLDQSIEIRSEDFVSQLIKSYIRLWHGEEFLTDLGTRFLNNHLETAVKTFCSMLSEGPNYRPSHRSFEHLLEISAELPAPIYDAMAPDIQSLLHRNSVPGLQMAVLLMLLQTQRLQASAHEVYNFAQRLRLNFHSRPGNLGEYKVNFRLFPHFRTLATAAFEGSETAKACAAIAEELGSSQNWEELRRYKRGLLSFGVH